MAKPAARITLLELGFAVAVLSVTARAGYLQLVDHERRSDVLNRQSVTREEIPARRGAVLDRHGAPLAITNSYYHVGLAPQELKPADVERTLRLVAGALDEPLAKLRRGVGAKRYLYFHGPYDASTVERLHGVRGVHLESELRRAYPAGALGLPVVGRLDPDSGVGASGIERALDSVLAGTPGAQVYLRAPGFRRIESPRRRVREPQAGDNVVLTIDANLQEIAEHIIDSTTRAFNALGGEVVVMDVRTGEILAAAGIARDRASGLLTPTPSFVTVPYEPGSTAKLFTAAALVELGRVKPGETVDGGAGLWVMQAPGMRTPRRITDEHGRSGPISLDTAIKISSNVALAKFAAKLTWNEQYEALRAFGFGTQTGIEATGEDRGLLQLPARWTGASSASLAMGYEFRLTSMQLAAAYSAIANGGVLLSPALVREVRSVDGTVRWRRSIEPVRRAISRATSRRLIEMLSAVTDAGGTAVRANMKVYKLAGKTGTANKFDLDCRCYRGGNIASFASVFPANDPQIAVVMKVDGPAVGRGFGGLVSGPAVKMLLEQMMASESAPVDRIEIANKSQARSLVAQTPSVAGPAIVAEPRHQAVTLPLRPQAASVAPVEVPAVEGRSVRDATALLLQAGLRVAAAPGPTVAATQPAAGTRVPAGTLVSLRTN